MNYIGNNIQVFLDEFNMNRVELARRLEVSPTAVWGWINGTRAPRMKYIDKMCEIFRCNQSDLLDAPKTSEEVETDVLMQRIMDAAARLNNEGKEKVLTYMQDLSGRYLK